MPAWFKAIALALPGSDVVGRGFWLQPDAVGGDGGVIAHQVCQLFGREVDYIVVGQRVEGVAVVVPQGQLDVAGFDLHTGVLTGGHLFIGGSGSYGDGTNQKQGSDCECGETFIHLFHLVTSFLKIIGVRFEWVF